MFVEHVDQEISIERHVECWSVNQQQCKIKNGLLGLLHSRENVITYDSCFCCGADEIFAALGCYLTLIGS
jgi:hypothetical protein